MSEHPSADLPGLLRGELSSEDGCRLGRHLCSCPSCRAELIDVAVAVAALDDLRRAGRVPEVAAPRRPARRRFEPWRWAAAVLAVLVLALAGSTTYLGLHNQTVPPSGPTVTLVGMNGSSASGQARMLGSGSEQRMLLEVHGLPAAPDGSFYEVTLIGSAGTLPVGILSGSEGTYPLPASVVNGYSAVVVELRHRPGEGSGQPVLKGSL
jgi:anti-sigma factor RsiW